MNGIDPLIIASGNDWRAIEAGAHAYAAREGHYKALTKWDKNEAGQLVGEIEIPIRIGVVGGSLQSNPAVGIVHRILGIDTSKELAELIAAVGLAQNLGAIRALVTKGIQSGHMNLHARSVASSAGASAANHEQVVEKLIASGEVKVWKAKEIIEKINSQTNQNKTPEKLSSGFGKIILLGEHAVVYGSHAIAAPVAIAMQATVSKTNSKGIQLLIPEWGISENINNTSKQENSLSINH